MCVFGLRGAGGAVNFEAALMHVGVGYSAISIAVAVLEVVECGKPLVDICTCHVVC